MKKKVSVNQSLANLTLDQFKKWAKKHHHLKEEKDEDIAKLHKELQDSVKKDSSKESKKDTAKK